MTKKIEGTFKPSPKGFGFIVDKNTNQKIVVPFKTLKKIPLFHGDLVSMEYDVSEDSKILPISLNILNIDKRTIIGTVRENNLIAENVTIPPIPLKEEISTGTIIKTTVVHDNGWSPSNITILGNLNDTNIEKKIAMSEYGIPDGILNTPDINEKELIGRKDYSNLEFVTIDGPYTKDIDDAIYVEKQEDGNYRLMVAIADVAQYVEEGTELDNFAKNRGTSVYFIQGTIHMLPSKLSEQALSLLPHKKRAVLVASMTITPAGVVLDTTLEEALIESKKRFTYDEVTALLSSKLESDPISTNLYNLEELYKVLLKNRIERHAIPIRSDQVEYKLNEQGKIKEIVKKPWHIAYGLVEEAMLVTNTSVGNWMLQNNLLGLYRHHNGPTKEKWDTRRSLYNSIGFELDENPSLQQISNLIETSKNTEHAEIIAQTVKTSMTAAVYDLENTHHFSLAYEWYTHFTSPIRRYADLTVHRIIKNYLNGRPQMDITKMQEIAFECTQKDTRAKLATRSEEKRLKVQYAVNYMNKPYVANVTGGIGSMLFVNIPELDISCGMPFNRSWSWNEQLFQIENSISGEAIKTGQSLNIKITDVNTDCWQIKSELDVTSLSPDYS